MTRLFDRFRGCGRTDPVQGYLSAGMTFGFLDVNRWFGRSGELQQGCVRG